MKKRNREAGISMVEVLLAVTVLGVTFISLGGAVMTGVQSTKQMDRRNIVRNQALRYVERLHKLNFGDGGENAASPSELDNLFSDKVEQPDVSLFQVATPVDEDGRKFTMSGFEVNGMWEVRVNRDVDGNGTINPSESVGDILRIEVIFDGRPVLTTFRAKAAQSL